MPEPFASIGRAKPWAGLALAGVLWTSGAAAASLSFTGTFTDPNQVFTTPFTLTASSALTIQTFGYGGSGNAAGGVNAAGIAIAAGGFDPYISLFQGADASATFLASNDDGVCGPGAGAADLGNCYDSTLRALEPAGSYTLALTLPANYSFAENQGSGTLADGFIGFATSFYDSAGNARTGAWAVDVTAAALAGGGAPIPEPDGALVAGLALGMAVLAHGLSGRAAREQARPRENAPSR